MNTLHHTIQEGYENNNNKNNDKKVRAGVGKTGEEEGEIKPREK